ncbi:ectonucleoside triphosphate diphosphohydrolase 3 [Eurytemora carolleeae]|uniref:ectonucleoside triphosphate diphosphohydrolase 3 n=1 Tax=Eurytemora carolleeae TaxID=1294199 RepID=UPI000C76777A|nr:ectonucleoside triphosphate diphosphohydrolase 3 [Eurytemora carolleeae]|eukprot:XP_023347048.1 ectonucleoside triphosphate diphosphohydrolase 3-like [Eurytemora affinis]
MNRVNSIPDSLRRVFSSSDMLTSLPFSARKLSHPGCEGRNYPYLLLVGLIALLILLCLVYTFGGNRVFSGKSSQLITEEINYGIVLDAGSSGTRAYLYYWPEHSGNKHDLLRFSI